MTREEALVSLASQSQFERLKAARFLAKFGEPSDLSTLRRRRRAEADTYVKSAIERAISRASPERGDLAGGPIVDLDAVPEDVRRELQGQAVRWIAGVLLHEIAGPIGLVDRAASQEILEYGASRTHLRIQSVKHIFEAIENLQTAATPAKPERFNVASFIRSMVFEEQTRSDIEVSQHGPSELEVTADPRLLRLAFCNGLRNAVDAVIGIPELRGQHPIVVTWNETDVDVWISIMDRGAGLSGPPEQAFEIGRSTKPKHRGFGLAIARQAMDSLGGSVSLSAASGGGVRYELRWER